MVVWRDALDRFGRGGKVSGSSGSTASPASRLPLSVFDAGAEEWNRMAVQLSRKLKRRDAPGLVVAPCREDSAIAVWGLAHRP